LVDVYEKGPVYDHAVAELVRGLDVEIFYSKKFGSTIYILNLSSQFFLLSSSQHFAFSVIW